MSNTERVAATCPSCSPDVETVHEILRSGGQATVRCTECSHVHKTKLESQSTDRIDVIVSQDGESFSDVAEVPVEETLAVGEEFILDGDEALMTVRITDLQLDADRRVDQAVAADVNTIWTRAVDNVAVKVTLHPKDGSREGTKGIAISVPGDHEFTVGETEVHDDEEFEIEQLLVRDDAVGYDREKYDRLGGVVAAKDVKRVYGRDQTSDAWSVW